MDSFLVIFYTVMACLTGYCGFMILAGKMKPNPLATGLVWLSVMIGYIADIARL